MKNLVLLTAVIVSLSGCAELKPEVQNALPKAQVALEDLAKVYFAFCTSEPKPAQCEQFKDALNAAIDGYNVLNVAAGGEAP